MELLLELLVEAKLDELERDVRSLEPPCREAARRSLRVRCGDLLVVFGERLRRSPSVDTPKDAPAPMPSHDRPV